MEDKLDLKKLSDFFNEELSKTTTLLGFLMIQSNSMSEIHQSKNIIRIKTVKLWAEKMEEQIKTGYDEKLFKEVDKLFEFVESF